jgi:carbon-monoxide dehydrogenase medium subunit
VLRSDLRLHRPTTIAEACALVAELGEDAGFVAGGTELLLLMKLGLADYGHLVDLKGIPELVRVDDGQGGLEIGGAVAHQDLADSARVRAAVPALAQLEGRLANLRVRLSGTLGGNLAFGDPTSDPATFLLAAGAAVVCAGPEGTRRELPVGDLLVAPYETVLDPGELLVTVRLPRQVGRIGRAHERFESRRQRPMATVSCVLSVDPEGVLDALALAAGALCPVPVRLPTAEQVLLGRRAHEITGAELAQLADAARDDVEVSGDTDATPEYKRQLLGVLVGRAARSALADARVATVS